MHHRQPNVILPVGRREQLTLLILLSMLLSGCATEAVKQPVVPTLINQIEVADWMTTSGQPDAVQLDLLDTAGYELVVNLSPLSSPASVPDEERIITSKGIDYVHIPVDVHAPALEQFEMFSDMLDRHRGRKTLVHCQVNMRASLFTFMYQVVHEGIDQDVAFQRVTEIWVPDNRWVDFIERIFARYKIEYQH